VNSLAHRLLHKTTVITLFLAGCAAGTPIEGSNSPISVVFVEPEKFTDARRGELEPNSPAIMEELKTFLIETGARYVPIELFRGPRADQVRITKGLYPPHLTLEFQLVDAAGRLIKAGKRKLTDLEYQLRVTAPREDYLRYEKELLRAWLRDELASLEPLTMQGDNGA
jgi:hypothetical protein